MPRNVEGDERFRPRQRLSVTLACARDVREFSAASPQAQTIPRPIPDPERRGDR